MTVPAESGQSGRRYREGVMGIEKTSESELEQLFQAYEQCRAEQRRVRVATCKGVVRFSPVDNDSRTVYVRLERKEAK